MSANSRFFGALVVFLNLILPLFAHANMFESENYLVSFVDQRYDGTPDDFLFEAIPRRVDIPYAINVEIASEYPSFLLLRQDDGTYTLVMLARGTKIPGYRVPTDLSYILEFRDVNGDGKKDVVMTPRALGGTKLVLHADGDKGVRVASQAVTIPSEYPVKAESVVATVSRPVDAVGELPARIDVDASGAVAIQIPVDVIPGLNGHQPSLTLSFNGRGGNGPLGTGWGLSGVQSISRCSSSPAQGDARFDGVNLSDSDRLCFNGQKMMLVSGSGYWAEGATYRTELYSQQDIVKKGTGFVVTGSDASVLKMRLLRDELWAVEASVDKFGNTIRYDYMPESGFSAALLPSNIYYGQAEIRFVYGAGRNDSPMRFLGGKGRVLDHYLKSIQVLHAGKRVREYDLHYRYDAISGLLQVKDVQLCAYEDDAGTRSCLPVLSPNYQAGTAAYVKKPFVLKAAFDPSQIARVATFDWNYDGVEDLLAIRKDGAVEVRHAVQSELGGSVNYSPVLAAGVSKYLVTPFISNAGDSGIVYLTMSSGVRRTVTETVTPAYTILRAAAGWSGIGGYCIQTKICPPGQYFVDMLGVCSDYSKPHLNNNYSGVIERDSFGRKWTAMMCDGNSPKGYFPALYETVPAKTEVKPTNIFDYTYKWTKRSVSGVETTLHAGSFCLSEADSLTFDPNIHFQRPVSGDFNGDGEVELFVPGASCNSSEFKWHKVIGSASVTVSPSIDMLRGVPFAFKSGSTTYVAERKNGLFNVRMGTELAGTSLKTAEGVGIPSILSVFADINGDGLSDVVSFGARVEGSVSDKGDTGYISLFMNEGGKFGEEERLNYTRVASLGNRSLARVLHFPVSESEPISDRVRVVDYDGNGLADLLVINGPSPLDSTYANKILLFRAVVNAQKRVVFEVSDTGIPNTNTRELDKRILVYDADGDGRADVLVARGTTYDLYGQNLTRHGLLTDISQRFPTGEEKKHSFEYKLLNDSSVHKWTFQVQHDHRTFVAPVPVVSRAYIPIRKGYRETSSYEYSNAKVNLRGRGFLGFEKITRTDAVAKRKTLSEFYGTSLSGGAGTFPVFPYIGVLVRQEVINTANHQVITAVANFYREQWITGSYSSRTVYPALSFQIANDLAGNRISATRTSTTLDGYANPDVVAVQTGTSDADYRSCATSTGGCPLKRIEHEYKKDSDYNASPVTFLNAVNETFSTPLLSVTGYGGTTAQLAAARVLNTSTLYSPAAGLAQVVGSKKVSSGVGARDAVQESYQYGTSGAQRGQLQSVTVSSADVTSGQPQWFEPRSTHYADYAYGAFPGQMTNALGYVSAIEVDYRSAKPTMQTDEGGRLSLFRYDPWARPVLAKNAAGLSTTTRYQYCGLGVICPSYAVNALFAVTQDATDGSQSSTYLDAYGRTVAESARRLTGDTVWVTYEYDERGRLVKQSEPQCSGTGCGTSTYTLIAYEDGRDLVTTTHPDSSTTYQYSRGNGAGLDVRVFQAVRRDNAYEAGDRLDKGVLVTRKQDVRGQVIESAESKIPLGTALPAGFYDATFALDPASSVRTRMAYDAKGRLIWSRVEGEVAGTGINTTIIHDDQQNTRTLMDPDSGTTVTWLNGAGEVVLESSLGLNPSDGSKNEIAYRYDRLGRQIAAQDVSGPSVANWYYDRDRSGTPCGNGLLCEVDDGSFNERFGYVSYSGLMASRETRLKPDAAGPEKTYRFDYRYDHAGRLSQMTYPSGLSIGQEYQHGYLVRVKDLTSGGGGQVLWRVDSHNAYGAMASGALGNGLQLRRSYDRWGRITAITAGTGSTPTQVQSQSYGYDSLGNLAYRKDMLGPKIEEVFQYDGLSRMVKQTLTEGASTDVFSYVYDNYGNMLRKGNVLDYRYQGYISADICNGSREHRTPGPHAVTYGKGRSYCYDEFGNQIRSYEREITFNAFSRPVQVKQGPLTLTYRYAPDESRYYQRRVRGAAVSETFYVAGGVFEEEIVEGVSTYKSYVGDFLIDARKAGQVTRRYLLRDHLGSVDTVTDDNVLDNLAASIVERMAYDPFGERRRDARGKGTLTPVTDDRGFTDHEHMDEVGLIHMNGRMYDPLVGRFISPDPLVQAPYSSQSYNRYSYVWNNPLSMVDPTGYESMINMPTLVVRPDETFISYQSDGHVNYYSDTVRNVHMGLENIGLKVNHFPDYSAVHLEALNFAVKAVHPYYQQELVQKVETLNAYHQIRESTASPATLDIARNERLYRDEITEILSDFACSHGGGMCGVSAVSPEAAMFLPIRGATLASGVARNFVAKGVRYGPTNPGPLDDAVAATFRGGSYTATTVAEITTLYRVYGGSSGKLGPYWTRTKPSGPLQSQLDSALAPQWGNTAQNVVSIRVPRGTTIYEGAAAPQSTGVGQILGGGNQVYIPRVDPKWIQ